MNVIDKFAETFSPKWALSRSEARARLEYQRNYDAAMPDRLNEGWRAPSGTGQMTDAAFRSTLRDRARDLERNSDILNGVLNAFERNVIGEGLRLQSKTGSKKMNDRIERLWREWCKAENCDATGQQSFEELTRMMLRRKKVDGGILVYFLRQEGGAFPLKLQLVEVDALCGVVAPKHEGNVVVDGVEVDVTLRHVGYWINQSRADSLTYSEPIFVPAENIVFYWSRIRPSQIREVSEMAPTLQRIRDITTYMTYVAEKERVGAALAAFITTDSPMGDSPGRYSLQGQGCAAGETAGVDQKIIEPGMIGRLRPGESVSTVTPPSTGSSAADFVKLQQRLVGAGQGLGYESISRDMREVNYSSARQGLIEDMATYKIERETLIRQVLQRVYVEFLAAIIESGLLYYPGYLSDKEGALKHEWVAPAKPWIDPVKEAQSNKIALETKQKTLTQIYAENGRDIEDVVEEMKTEQELMKGVKPNVPTSSDPVESEGEGENEQE